MFLEGAMMRYSISYFIVDTIAGIVKGYNDIWLAVHHLSAFGAYAIAFYT